MPTRYNRTSLNFKNRDTQDSFLRFQYGSYFLAHVLLLAVFAAAGGILWLIEDNWSYVDIACFCVFLAFLVGFSLVRCNVRVKHCVAWTAFVIFVVTVQVFPWTDSAVSAKNMVSPMLIAFFGFHFGLATLLLCALQAVNSILYDFYPYDYIALGASLIVIYSINERTLRAWVKTLPVIRTWTDDAQCVQSVTLFLTNIIATLSRIVSSISLNSSNMTLANGDVKLLENLLETQHSASDLLSMKLDNIAHASVYLNRSPRLLVPRIDTFGMLELVTRCIRVVEQTMENPNVSFETIIEQSVPEYVVSGAHWVSCCVLNYLENAVESLSVSDSKRVVVTVSNSIPGLIRVDVSDNGTGVHSDMIPDMFSRDHLASSKIDLVSVKSRMDTLGGTCGYKPNVPCGSTFWISFPVMIPDTLDYNGKNWILYNRLDTLILCTSSDRLHTMHNALKKLGINAHTVQSTESAILFMQQPAPMRPIYVVCAEAQFCGALRMVASSQLIIEIESMSRTSSNASVNHMRSRSSAQSLDSFSRLSHADRMRVKSHSDPELIPRKKFCRNFDIECGYDEYSAERGIRSKSTTDICDLSDDVASLVAEVNFSRLFRSKIAESRCGSVLVVDDSRVIQKTLRRMICKHGFQVDIASNGREGLERLRTGMYSICFCDVVMPLMGGVEMIERLQAETDVQRPYIVIVTAQLHSSHTLDALCDSLVFKPFSDDSVVTELKRSVDHFFKRLSI
jgi:CheY-like chemotaxis protein/signal transduction histidine kinase